jgi:hypothetical protein
MKSSTRLAFALAVPLTIGVGFLACGGDDEPKANGGNGGGNEPTGELGTLKLLFSPMYSAYEPEHKYQIPVILEDGQKGATFTASDPSKVDVANTPEGALLTMKGAGKVTITAKLGSESGSATLTITEATPDDWKRGEARYTNGIDALPTDGGTVSIAALGTRNPEGACTTCHSETAKILNIQHTPQQTGGYTDDELVTIFTQGDKPTGGVQRSGIPEFLWGMAHKWDVEEADKKGLVTYLRSLPPKTQGEIDFGFRRVDGGFVDRDGNPIVVPRRDGGARPGTSDAGSGTTTTTDSGSTSTASDAGVAAPEDAGSSATTDAG